LIGPGFLIEKTLQFTQSMAGQNLTGIARMQAAFLNSVKGYKSTWDTEEAFRQEVYLLAIAVPLGLWLGDNGIEKALLVGSVLLVAIVELLNTGIEVVVDRISYERHELSGKAKDIGSAAVLTALFLAGLTWVLILAPHYF
jgi:diacylglycerol kinase (ATP)